MNTVAGAVTEFPRYPREMPASHQDSMPGRYRWPVQALSLAAFTLAFFGWLNETWLFLFDNPIWLNRYTEYAIILGFGVWRIYAEQNPYTRRRLTVLVAVVTAFWWLIPWATPFFEPYAGFLWSQPIFPSLHVPGTLTFFLVLAFVFLFGRRVICGWGCPCVGIRETVGFPFRAATLRSEWVWKLRHVKWLFFIYYVGVMVATQYPPNSWTVSFVGGFYLLIAATYFGTFFIAPITGNRFYCRHLCPFGATFGLLNHAGFFGVRMDRERCIDCRRCEQVCDMGIPVWKQGKQRGEVTAIEDCMGCARCVTACPTDALEIRDVRNVLRRGLRRDGSHLLKAARTMAPRALPEARTGAAWSDDGKLDPAAIQSQAARCLDCGVPACRSACPLHNRIPEWMSLVANGNLEAAAAAAHATSPLPEICGRLCPQERLCEGACARERQGEGAVAIGAVERFLTDEAFASGWAPVLAPRRRTERRAAIIGAGPAGLACAERLNREGWRVTVIDRERKIGGLLANGVPPFRLDKGILERRHELLRKAGVTFELGTTVDEARFRDLLSHHDALFLATGSQRPRSVGLPGKDLPGVSEALAYLARVNAAGGGTEMREKRVLVLGGGDTALDCARSALRQGATEVTVAYRGAEARMRATRHEREQAMKEGVRFRFERAPREILGTGPATGVKFAVGGNAETMPCDAVILAFGFTSAPLPWLASFGIGLDERGFLKVDADGRTTNPRVYAGGDNIHGPDLVVTAIAAGRRAAEAMIHDFKASRRIAKTFRAILRPATARLAAQREVPG